MTSFYYYDQNPSGFCFLVQIRAFFNLNLAGISKFKYERKNEEYSGSSAKTTPPCKWPIPDYFRFRKTNEEIRPLPTVSEEPSQH